MEQLTSSLSTLAINDSNKEPLTSDNKQVPKKRHYPLYISIELSGEQTENLKQQIMTLLPQVNYDQYETKRGMADHAHLTLRFSTDSDSQSYKDAVDQTYSTMSGQTQTIDILGVGVDQYCVALNAKPQNVPYYPLNRHTHITLMLHEKKPVYSNELLTRLLDHDPSEMVEGTYYPLKESITVTGTLRLIGKMKEKKEA